MMIMFRNDGKNAQLHQFFHAFCDIHYTKMIGKIYKQIWSIDTVNIFLGKMKKSLGEKVESNKFTQLEE